MSKDKGSIVTIEKVGRKYAYLNNGHRIFLGDFTIDGGQYSSPGKCYLSEKEYLDKIERQRAVSEFRKLMTSISFKTVTLEQIKAAKEALGVQDEKTT